MNQAQFVNLIKTIAKKSNDLKNEYLDNNARVNYACVFAQNELEYAEFDALANNLGERVLDTKTGFVYKIKPLKTVAGDLRVLKIRKPDPTRTELGDADFTIEDFTAFKQKYLKLPQFSLIVRPNMEMVELREVGRDILAYFSNPPIDQELGIK